MSKKSLRLFHFTLPLPTNNFGDDVIFLALRENFENIFEDYEVEWTTFDIHNLVTKEVIKEVNSCDLVIVGGGGLLLRGDFPDPTSGWSWNCPIELVKEIGKPLMVYSIGYNRFRNQEEFDPIFFDHLKVVIEKASLFTVRNTGSKRALDNYGVFPDKIRVNPCPSLFFNHQPTGSYQDTGRIGVNLAGDRGRFRFDNREEFYSELELFLLELIGRGYEIHFIRHGPDNCDDFLLRFSGPKAYCSMSESTGAHRHLGTYQSFDLTLAMRGHALLIPFGLHKKVVSLVSQPKLSWFLEDFVMEDTGVDINGNNFPNNLSETFEGVMASKDYYRRQDEALKRLAVVFGETNDIIRGLL